jgi:hypothetical protein
MASYEVRALDQLRDPFGSDAIHNTKPAVPGSTAHPQK